MHRGEGEGSCGGHHHGCPMHGHMGMEHPGAEGWHTPKMMIKIALFKAKVCLLEEKLRPRLAAELGDDLDKAAEAIVQAVVKKRRAKIEICKQKFELREKLRDIFFEGDEEEEAED